MIRLRTLPRASGSGEGVGAIKLLANCNKPVKT